MATPQFSVQTSPITIVPNNPGSYRITTLDPTGAAIDVSTGFTISTILYVPASGRNLDYPGYNLSANFTAAFDTTGVTLSWTGAQAGNISDTLDVSSNRFAVNLTNDSAATSSVVASGALTIESYGGLV